jgi:hypothetical protein
VAASPAAEIALHVSATPDDAALFLDGAPVGRGAYSAAVRRDGLAHEIRVEAPGFAGAVERVVFDRDRVVGFILAGEPRAEPSAAAAAAAPAAAASRPGSKRRLLDQRNPYAQ